MHVVKFQVENDSLHSTIQEIVLIVLLLSFFEYEVILKRIQKLYEIDN